MKSDPKRGSRRLVLASSMLAAAIVVPVIGGASAAPLASAPFHVKAQNAEESTRFAIKPLLKKPSTADPTAPGTATPTTPPSSSSPSPTAEPTSPPVTTPPPFSPSTIYSHNGAAQVGTGSLQWRISSAYAWSNVSAPGGSTGQATGMDKTNQNAFLVRTTEIKDRTIRLSVPDLEPGTYTFSIWGSGTKDTIWTISTAGAASSPSTRISSYSWVKMTYTFTTDTKGSRDILMAVNMPSTASYGDDTRFDDVLLRRIA
jgi:hypothetical protein